MLLLGMGLPFMARSVCLNAYLPSSYIQYSCLVESAELLASVVDLLLKLFSNLAQICFHNIPICDISNSVLLEHFEQNDVYYLIGLTATSYTLSRMTQQLNPNFFHDASS